MSLLTPTQRKFIFHRGFARSSFGEEREQARCTPRPMTVDGLLIRRAVVSGGAVIYWAGVAIHARRIRKRIGKSANLKPRTPKEKLLWAGWTFMILGWLFQPLLISGTNFSSPSPPEKEERAGVRSHGFST